MVAYAQPLIDETDGSPEDIQRAMSLAMMCYNLGQLPHDRREEVVNDFQGTLEMNDVEFAEFKRDLIEPMIQRHEQMFSSVEMSDVDFAPQSRRQSGPAYRKAAGEPYPGTDPYGPCPCESGKKYKFCCRKKRTN